MKRKAKLIATLKAHSKNSTEDWSHLVDFAQAADDAGLDQLAISDHVAFGEHLDAYSNPAIGGRSGGVQPTGPDGAWLDPLTTIAHLTAVTKRVRFSTSILIAALRRPLVLAKMAATIDVLSGGRLELGVGVGWQREEYEAAGLPFAERGRLLNQTIEVCQKLWRDEKASYDDQYLRFDDIHQMPKPIQPGGVPIWVSGTVNARSMERLARYGSGWIPWGDDATNTLDGIGRMHAAIADLGRDPNELGVMARIGTINAADGVRELARMMESVPRLIDAGVTDFRIDAFAPIAREAATEFLREVVEAFNASRSKASGARNAT